MGTPGIHVGPGLTSECLIEGHRRLKIEHDPGTAEQENGVRGDAR